MLDFFIVLRQFLQFLIPRLLPVCFRYLFGIVVKSCVDPCTALADVRGLQSVLFVYASINVSLVRELVYGANVPVFGTVNTDKSAAHTFCCCHSSYGFRFGINLCLNIVCRCSSILLLMDHLIVKDLDLVSLDVLHTAIQRTGFDSVFQFRLVNVDKRIKYGVLFVHFQRKNTV